MHEKQTNNQSNKHSKKKRKKNAVSQSHLQLAIQGKYACMHAYTPTIDQPTTVLCCVHNHHHHHRRHIMIDDMMMMLHIESNSKLHNKSKVSTFRLCIWSKEEETLCIWAPFPPFFFFFVFFLLVL
jgi:hypothetical protein